MSESHTTQDSTIAEKVYNHKKFDCAQRQNQISSRRITRDIMVEATRHRKLELKETKLQHSTSLNGLFRPYALGDDTPRKHETELGTIEACNDLAETAAVREEKMLTSKFPHQSVSTYNLATPEMPTFNRATYTIMLQKQMQAFQMRQVMEMQAYTMGQVFPPMSIPIPK